MSIYTINLPESFIDVYRWTFDNYELFGCIHRQGLKVPSGISITKAVNKASQVLGLLMATFTCLDETTVPTTPRLFTTIVCPNRNLNNRKRPNSRIFGSAYLLITFTFSCQHDQLVGVCCDRLNKRHLRYRSGSKNGVLGTGQDKKGGSLLRNMPVQYTGHICECFTPPPPPPTGP